MNGALRQAQGERGRGWAFESPFESLKTGSGQAQGRPFENLRRAPSRASGEAQGERGPSTSPSRTSGEPLREPQDRPRVNGKRQEGVNLGWGGPFDKPFENLRRASG